MANKTIKVRHQQKIDTSTNWATNNPVLLAGEIGVESNTGRIKIGDGKTAWKDLEYTIEKTANMLTSVDKVTYFKLSGMGALQIGYQQNILLGSRGGETVIVSLSKTDSTVSANAVRIVPAYKKITALAYNENESALYVTCANWADNLAGNMILNTLNLNVLTIESVESVPSGATAITINDLATTSDLSSKANTTALNDYMKKSNPVGSGTLSINRKTATTAGDYSTTVGYNGTASGLYSYTEGYDNTSSGQASHAEGSSNTSSALGSHAEGNYTTASGRHSHAEGYYTTANSQSQHVFGNYNILDSNTNTANKGTYIEIVGNGTSDARSNARTLDWQGNEWVAGKYTCGADKAEVALKTDIPSTDSFMAKTDPTGTGSFSFNRKAGTTIGTHSFAEGYNTTASGGNSHAENNNTTASGGNSHAEGNWSSANGGNSHAEGDSTQANGLGSHAQGLQTIANGDYQHVMGRYNLADTTSLEIVGNGTALDARSNARLLDAYGNEWLAGQLTINGSGTIKYDASTNTFTL